MRKKLVFLLILFTLNSTVLAENYTIIEEDTTHSNSFNNETLAWDVTYHNDATGTDDLTSSADPFLFKDGDTFYLLATTNRFWKSKDLLTWEEIRGGVVNDPTLVGEKFWAPEVYKYNNRYYLLYTSDDVDGNNWKKQLRLSVTDNIEAGFSKGTIVNLNIPSSASYNPFNPVKWSNVDGSIFFEGNKKYLYFKNAKLKATYVVELDDNFAPIITENSPKYLLSTVQYVDDNTAPDNNSKHPDSPDWEHTRIEGPFVFKRNGTYYLTYSAGDTGMPDYSVGYAKSTTGPMGNFYRGITEKPLLYEKDLHVKNVKGNNRYISGTGHNMVYEDESGELYIAYHGIQWNKPSSDASSQRIKRKLMLDYLGIDENGDLFVNGVCIDNQPLPAGIKDLFYLSPDKYTVSLGGNLSHALSDKVDYNCKTKTAAVAVNNSIDIEINDNNDVKNIWLFGTSSGFGNIKADILINNKYLMQKVDLGTEPTREIQFPDLNEATKSIKINTDQNVSLSEVKLYYAKTNREVPADEAKNEDQNKEEQKSIDVDVTNTNKSAIFAIIIGLTIIAFTYSLIRFLAF